MKSFFLVQVAYFFCFFNKILSNNIYSKTIVKNSLNFNSNIDYCVGWGRKRSGRRAVLFSKISKNKCLLLEDGFIRSYAPGQNTPQLSLVIDDIGIYYDVTTPSKLENILQNESNLLDGREQQINHLIKKIVQLNISKYNHAPDFNPDHLIANDQPRILVVDQTYADLSLHYGGVNDQVFQHMLQDALAQNPTATIYIKTHPEVTTGHKSGHFAHLQNSDRIVVLRELINPLTLLKHMDQVYVATSTMGFEALLLGKKVHCYGMPWYAGWGLTNDKLTCSRRTQQRTVQQLFAAAYLDYSIYLNPITHEANGSLEQVIDWIDLQRAMAKHKRIIAYGFRKWKAYNLREMLSFNSASLVFVRTEKQLQQLNPIKDDILIHWGNETPTVLQKVKQQTQSKIFKMEDGFIRSVGLGSDLIAPQSIVLDDEVLYFDPTQPSRLEQILQTRVFDQQLLQQAEQVRQFIVQHKLTKYNTEPFTVPNWHKQSQKIIIVPGQVEDDASIRFGCSEVSSNLALLEKVRSTNADAYIVYKPHPDVMSGNRKGKLHIQSALQFANFIETKASIISCIEHCHELHTMTSLSGFDALLRDKKVVVHGQPFYAGWGLTEDVYPNGIALKRRSRSLSLDQLVAGSLLLYPIYWDPVLKGYTDCMSCLNQILRQRVEYEKTLHHTGLKMSKLRRYIRKINLLIKAYLCKS